MTGFEQHSGISSKQYLTDFNQYYQCALQWTPRYRLNTSIPPTGNRRTAPILATILEFQDPKLLWYHYHPSVPYLEKNNKKDFRHQGIKYEHENSGWRGMLLCSAFVVEATIPEVE